MLEKYKGRKLDNALLSIIKGFSPVLCREICYRANIDSDMSYEQLSPSLKTNLNTTIKDIIETIVNDNYSPCIIYVNDKPKDYYPIKLTQYDNIINIDTFNEALEEYFIKFSSGQLISVFLLLPCWDLLSVKQLEK